MCVAIYKPIGKTLTKQDLSDAWDTNPHGGGYAYRKYVDDDVVICKGIMGKKAWIKGILDLGADYEVIAHARIATHGTKTADNTHPFPIADGRGAWIHNGIISGYPRDKKESDTLFFTWEFLDPLFKHYPDWLERPFGAKILGHLLDYSKGILMMKGYPVTILNEHLCTTLDGVVYSNMLFRPRASQTDWTDWEYDPVTKIRRYKPRWRGGQTGYNPGYDAAANARQDQLFDKALEAELEKGESTGEDETVIPVSQLRKLLNEAQDRDAQPTTPLSSTWVMFNGQKLTYAEYQQMHISHQRSTHVLAKVTSKDEAHAPVSPAPKQLPAPTTTTQGPTAS